MEKFTKVKNIGKGNMGACALARNNEDGCYYVIKQVDLAKLNKKERQQSLNEAKVLSSLRHANVINYVDSFLARKSDHLCIVMEYADGGDLSAKVKHSHGVNFSQDQILDWFIQCALALHYIHSKKILHRDVKTQNIFLTQEGVCKLGDFGIARTLSNTFDQANTFVGTPYYLSPELILERPYDYASDVWALGVVLYELMALKHPFNAADMKALMHRILKVQYDPPPQMYSNDLRSIVGRLLVKDPAQRMRLSEVLELPVVTRRLQQWLQGGIVPSRYVASLVRHKQLPAGVLAMVPGLTSGDALPQVGSLRQQAALPMPSLSAAAPVPAVAPSQSTQLLSDARIAQRLREEQLAKQARREEIREQFRDIRAVPKKGPTPPPFHVGGEEAPMPSRDPDLLRAENYPTAYVRKASVPVSSAAQIPNQQRLLPSLNAGPMYYNRMDDDVVELNENRQLPHIIRGNGPTNLSAMPRVMQPSVRGLHGAAAPPPAKLPPPNANIQAMLEKAAQQRLAKPQPIAKR